MVRETGIARVAVTKDGPSVHLDGEARGWGGVTPPLGTTVHYQVWSRITVRGECARTAWRHSPAGPLPARPTPPRPPVPAPTGSPRARRCLPGRAPTAAQRGCPARPPATGRHSRRRGRPRGAVPLGR